MDCYISRQQITQACLNMQAFYHGLANHYISFGLNIESNRGRRNILMSEPMENFLAAELEKTLKDVVCDGRSGKSDIVFNMDGSVVELECKLTSPHESSGSITFQTDYETLAKKGKLDYIYIVANEDFTGFCAVFFKGLTTEDFRSLSPGARGKVQMYKHKGMQKATILLGDVVDLKKLSVNKEIKKRNLYIFDTTHKINTAREKLENLRHTQVYDRNKYTDIISRLQKEQLDKLNKFDKNIILKKNKTSRYSFVFEKIGDQK